MTDLDGMGMSNPDEEFQPDTGWVERQRKRMAEDNTLRVTVAHLTADLRAELAAVTKDRDELSALIEKQHSRVIKAIRLWRKAHPGNELTWPDLGALIEWLIERKGAAK